jgi:hypothetical protein
VKVRITVELSDEQRRAINKLTGRLGKASYEQTRTHLISAIEGDLQSIVHELINCATEKDK